MSLPGSQAVPAPGKCPYVGWCREPAGATGIPLRAPTRAGGCRYGVALTAAPMSRVGGEDTARPPTVGGKSLLRLEAPIRAGDAHRAQAVRAPQPPPPGTPGTLGAATTVGERVPKTTIAVGDREHLRRPGQRDGGNADVQLRPGVNRQGDDRPRASISDPSASTLSSYFSSSMANFSDHSWQIETPGLTSVSYIFFVLTLREVLRHYGYVGANENLTRSRCGFRSSARPSTMSGCWARP